MIKAECEYALSDNASEEDMLEALSSIDEQTDKMTKLVTALLTLSRTEQGDKRYKLEDTDLSELVKKHAPILSSRRTSRSLRTSKTIL